MSANLSWGGPSLGVEDGCLLVVSSYGKWDWVSGVFYYGNTRFFRLEFHYYDFI